MVSNLFGGGGNAPQQPQQRRPQSQGMTWAKPAPAAPQYGGMPPRKPLPTSPQPPQTGGGWQDRIVAGQQPPPQVVPAQQPAQSPPMQQDMRYRGTAQPQQGGFNAYMSNMRKQYRGSMQGRNLSREQISQNTARMQAHQKQNRSQIANQYMREQMPAQRQNPWSQPMPAQGARKRGMAAVYGNPGLSQGEMGQVAGSAMEQFNQRGMPTASRANLLPQQQQGAWQQRMAGGMRGNPRGAPMPRRQGQSRYF